MRIIDRKEFLNLPSGTVFRKYKPQYYEDIEIKGDTWSNDFLVQRLHGDIEGTVCSSTNSEAHDVAVETGESFRFDLDSLGRDGYFDEDQLFAVYDNDDIIQLIKTLIDCIQ